MKNLINNLYDVVIIGSGPGGMTSGIYVSRAGLKTLIIEKEAPGGKMIKTAEIENYPGFDVINGVDLSMKMYEHTMKVGVEFKFAEVQSIFKSDNLFNISLVKDNNLIQSKTVIIATGMKENPLNVPGEEKYYGRGVSYCAVCDGALYKNKTLVVVGGGYSAVEEALYLTRFAQKLYLIHRRDEFKADQNQVQKLKQHSQVEFILDTQVTKIKGVNNKVSAIEIVNVKTNQVQELSVDAVFPYIGATPITNFLTNWPEILNEKKYITTDNNMQTKIEGLYAIGDVREKLLRQIVTATGDGAVAAQAIIEFLED